MKNQCIIFVLKNHEDWLLRNIEEILKLKSTYDLYFVTRIYSEQINQILSLNKLVNISFSYDSGYYDALRAGFEFVQNLKYHTWIEFGECNNIKLEEIQKLNTINADYEYNKSVIFCSKHVKKRSFKKYIYISIGKNISDPYSRFRIYNQSTFELMKHFFSFNMSPQNFINLIYKKPDFIEVRLKPENKSKKSFSFLLLSIRNRFKLFIYAIFILPFIKRNGLNKY